MVQFWHKVLSFRRNLYEYRADLPLFVHLLRMLSQRTSIFRHRACPLRSQELLVVVLSFSLQKRKGYIATPRVYNYTEISRVMRKIERELIPLHGNES